MIREGLTFDDVLLEPVHSNVQSREEVDLTVSFPYGLEFDHPIVPANMADVASTALLAKQGHWGGLSLLHRFQTVADQIAQFVALGEDENRVGASVGVKGEEMARVANLWKAGIRIFCIDVAHGDHDLTERAIRFIRNELFGVTIIAGNVATKEGAKYLWQAGADIVKVGVGPGSLCTTRIETGCGVPQLTAIMDVAEMRESFFPEKGIIADGGIKNAGDCVKALCFADMVMVGRLFAGCDETSGFEGGNYKIYNGSSTHKTSHVEGVRAKVNKVGTYAKVLNRLLEGIRSGCSYQGAFDLDQLKDSPRLIRITSAGLQESYPHDVVIVSDAG